MFARLKQSNIRTRLLLVSLGIILGGLSILTIIAGGQINTAVRAEYEQHLQDEIRLIAQGVAPLVVTDSSGKLDLTRLNAALPTYETQTGGKLVAFPIGGIGGGPDNEQDTVPGAKGPPPRGGSFFNMPEMETALRGEIVLVAVGFAAAMALGSAKRAAPAGVCSETCTTSLTPAQRLDARSGP